MAMLKLSLSLPVLIWAYCQLQSMAIKGNQIFAGLDYILQRSTESQVKDLSFRADDLQWESGKT